MSEIVVNPVTAVFLMALVTFLPRVLPIAFFRREISSPYVKAFFNYVPFAVLGAMTFPDVFTSTGNIISAAVGCGVAVLLSFRGKSLLFVTSVSIAAVYLIGLILS
mgnify:FL=1|jgi:branched-subunit amino acid transport protein